MTGTERILQVAVTNAPHFLSNCVKTQPTGEQPSVTSTLQRIDTSPPLTSIQRQFVVGYLPFSNRRCLLQRCRLES